MVILLEQGLPMLANLMLIIVTMMLIHAEVERPPHQVDHRTVITAIITICVVLFEGMFVLPAIFLPPYIPHDVEWPNLTGVLN